jgi:TetR/AcrR family transcriptional regulator, regulator of mycofactocin system
MVWDGVYRFWHSVSNVDGSVVNESPGGRGRPRSATRDQVSAVALDLFARRGFDATTLDDVAEAVGVSRRTLLRYYPSKNDLVWGAFSEHLVRFREMLASAPADEPLMDVVRRGVIAFNDYGPEELPRLRIRMELITGVPALQAHSALRYAEWRAVVAEFVAQRAGSSVDDLIPQTVAHVALGASMATYGRWIAHGGELLSLLDAAFRLVASGFPLGSLTGVSRTR